MIRSVEVLLSALLEKLATSDLRANSVALLIAKSAHMPGLEAKSAYCVVTAPWKRFFLPLVRGLVVR